MTGLAFFDTNILIYADDGDSPMKQRVAIDLVAEHGRRNASVISLQVPTGVFRDSDSETWGFRRICAAESRVVVSWASNPFHGT